MLDVHLPHRAIHGLGELLLHLFTISLGLLIAVGIEGAVTRHEHRKLAEEALESMTAEIRRNLDNTETAVKKVEAQQARMKSNLLALAKIQANPKAPGAQDAQIDATYASTGFESTAWRTAQATGALSYMPYEEAQKLSSIYQQVEKVEKAQEAIVEDEALFLGVVHRYTGKGDDMSKEQADAMAERFGIWQGHLLTIHIAVRVLEEDEKAFLEHREPNHQLFEKIDN